VTKPFEEPIRPPSEVWQRIRLEDWLD